MPQARLPAPAMAAIQAYVDELTHRFGGQLVDVMLFGSQARGQATRDSDIDIMVVLDHPAARDLSEARGIAFDVWLTHGVLLSIRALSRESWRELEEMNSLFYRNVMHDRLSLFPVAA